VTFVPSAGLVDLHSHLVPGVDDGARTMEDVIEGLGRMVERGVRSVVTTPHLVGSLTHDSMRIEHRLQEVAVAWAPVREEVRRHFPDLEFERAFEILLDVPDPDLSLPGLCFPGTRTALVEWPSLRIPVHTGGVLGRLVAQGYQPVLAHPERYRGYSKGLAEAVAWRQEGAALQMNYGALAGRYGPEVHAQAVQLLERGWVDFFSTDFHGRSHLRLYIREVGRIFSDLGAEEAWSLLCQVNPDRVRRGLRPLPVPPISFSPGVLGRVREWFRRRR
jgi:protein-tyrosine phosphatase